MVGATVRGWVRAVGLVAAGAALWFAGAGAVDLPDHRGYELVSPVDKQGGDVMAESSVTRAAAGESVGLPAAVSFASLQGFGDVQGMGIATEYLAERDGLAGTSGWSTHAITPRQDALSLSAAALGIAPAYDGEMSPDLTKGTFRSWSPLTDAPNVAHVENLYTREDLRTPGAGVYRLLTDAPLPIRAPDENDPLNLVSVPFVAAASPDFQHVLFESKLNLTADATGGYVKLYEADGSVTHLVSAGGSCPGGNVLLGPGPCSAAGLGATALQYTQPEHVLSADGSRVIFTSPVDANGIGLTQAGVAARVFQLDDRGTVATDDDAVVQLNTSEKAVPAVAMPAAFQIASVDGSRVFFLSDEQLTARSGGGLYMWERQATDEQQSVSVDATGGSFALTFHTQLSTGQGVLTAGSSTVTSIAGSFAPGEAVSGTGVPAGATITAVGNGSLTLSANATGSGLQTLHVSVDSTTAPLAFDADAGEVQSALEALRGIGTGNVQVSGGPGSAGGSTPYMVTFTGALAGVDVAQLSADGSALTGGAAAATVTTTRAVRNLTLIASITGAPYATGVIGASQDGHRLYFAASGSQLVPSGPPVTQDGIYYWQDADGTPGGTLSYVGSGQLGDLGPVVNYSSWSHSPKVARVTPDGRFLVFEVSVGDGLRPGYDQVGCQGESNPNNNSNSTGGCSEVYVYRADGSAPVSPDVVCVSCDPGGRAPVDNAWINIRRNASAGNLSTHLSHALSDDGRFVFFSSADPLVPQAVNGKFNVYEYDVDDGTVRLLSSGTDSSDSFFLDASSDGHDVYFITRERLVGWDTDSAYDIYDARVDGGFPQPSPAPVECVGDACHGVASGVPAPPLVGSVVLQGRGNVRAVLRARKPARVRCKRGQVRRRVHGRVRCVKQAKKAGHAKARRAAKAGRARKAAHARRVSVGRLSGKRGVR